ncbi:MAG TPA: trypsin-like peptidase domain-containing protein [Polyangiaceae bacterium]|nr:trypsin-like peptidase domain-containing protein [Polyangiaceae bacterium]
MRRWHHFAIALLACQSLAGCAPEAGLSDLDLQSLCERSSKLQDVAFYDGSMGVPTAFVNRHRLAVGLLRWKSDLRARYFDEEGNVSGKGWCTGTLIDEDLFLTAGHCLDNADSGTWKLPHEKGHVPLRSSELAREFVVDFRSEISASPNAPSRKNSVEVVRLEEHRLGGLDYAILRLSGRPGLQNGVTRISPGDSWPGAPIAILQHPLSEPMKIGAGSVLTVQGSKIAYDTIDTSGGSSGSGILDARTGKLVGVHTNGGCTKSGGENYGVTIGALIGVSSKLRDLADRSRDFMVGDWDNDGLSDLAVLDRGCSYPDANHDGAPDKGLQQCAPDANADQYLVGKWQPGRPSGLGWRRGRCVYLDTKPKQPLCYGDAPFELLIADWDGDGASDLGVRIGSCIDFDLDLDGLLDQRGYCYGDGSAEDEYLVGNWDGGPRASVAIRRSDALLLDLDRDGRADASRSYGLGGEEHQYLVGDWNGDLIADLAVRRGNIGLMNYDAAAGLVNERRVYRDFWSEQ